MPRNATDSHILGILEREKEALIRQMADVALGSGDAGTRPLEGAAHGETIGRMSGGIGHETIDRLTIEQLLRALVAVLGEWLVGESKEIRQSFLEAALPELARSGASPWDKVLRDGLPCWGILIGIVAGRAEESRRPSVIHRLAQIQGEWWADVWKAMCPVYKEIGDL